MNQGQKGGRGEEKEGELSLSLRPPVVPPFVLTHLNGSRQLDIDIGERSVEYSSNGVVTWELDGGLVSAEDNEPVSRNGKTVARSLWIAPEIIPPEATERFRRMRRS